MVFLLRLLMLFLGMVLTFTCANITMAQTQSQGGQEQRESLRGGSGQSMQTSPDGAATRGSSGGSSIRVVPFITVSERYDSNVRLTTPKIYDYVTTINPNVRVEYRSDLAQGTLTGGFRSEVYVRNPELNYVGFNGSMIVNLDDTVGKMVRGLGLRVTDSVVYTPQPPALLTPEAPETSFFHGIQVYRSNTLTNAAGIHSTYAMTPLAQLNASYSYRMTRFLDQSTSGATGTLFNTNIQSFTTGPQYQTTPTQSIGASYQYQHFSNEPNTGGMGNVTVVHGAMAAWKTSLTRELTLDVSPGASIVTNIPDKPQWTMRGSLQWHDGSTTAALSYVRIIRPSMFISSSTLVSEVVAASLSQNLTSEWSIFVQSSYALNKSIGQTPIRFESFAQTGSLNYAFYPGMVASASVTYYNFSTAGIQNQRFDRQLAMISLTAEWN